MTPKEKADELYKLYYRQLNHNMHMEMEAKECALVCADELIKHLPSSAGNPPNLQENEYNCEWWGKVKQEIEKL